MELNKNHFDKTVVAYLSGDGSIVIHSEDYEFTKQVRTNVENLLKSPSTSIITITNSDELITELAFLHERKVRILLFIEREILGRNNIELIKFLKTQYKRHIKIIVLSDEVDRTHIAYLHEMGADSVIIKPISNDNLLEKVALVIESENKLRKLISLGYDLLEQGETIKSLAITEKIGKLKPDSASMYILRGDIFLRMSKIDDAIENYERATVLAELYIEPLIKLSRLYNQTKNTEKYLNTLLKLDSISPNNIERKIEISKMYYVTGNVDQSIHYSNQTIDLATKEALDRLSSIVENNLVNMYSSDHPEIAIDYLKNVLEIKGRYLTAKDLSIYNSLGIMLRKEGKWQEAIDMYEKAKSVASNNPHLFYNQSLAYVDGKHYKEALDCITQVIALDPNFGYINRNVAFNMGMVFYHNGLKDKAVKLLEISKSFDYSKATDVLERIKQEK